jgi:histidine triad (HIT) family protein
MIAHHAAGCIFCRIAAGQQRADVIYEDELVIAFPDIHPIRPGHTQVICRGHISYFEDLPDDIASRMLGVGQRIARAMKSSLGVPRVAFLLTGGDIAHAHAHLVPMHEDTDITSRQYIAERDLTFRSMPRASDEELAATAAMLRSSLEVDRSPQGNK